MKNVSAALSAVLLSGLMACGTDTESRADDSGALTASYQEFLLDWYADYDAGAELDYLSQSDTWERDLGDDVKYDALLDAAYGPHGERTTMDVYVPAGAESAPVVLFVHGGGFRSKDKDDVLNEDRLPVVGRLIADGFAVASINYRFRSDGLEKTETEPDWGCSGTLEDGCRLDVIYRDGARAVQYLRYRSEDLKIDPDRIGAWGRSAGSQIVTWVGLVPDLAVADHEDPVLQQSTRLQAVGHANSQATGPSHLWPELITFPQTTEDCDPLELWGRLAEFNGETGYNQSLQSTIEDLDSAAGQDLMRVVHFLEAMDADDPPFITTSPVQDLTCEDLTALSDEDLSGKMLHHPRHSEPLYQRCQDEGLQVCEKVTAVEDTFSGTSDAYQDDEEQLRLFMIDTL